MKRFQLIVIVIISLCLPLLHWMHQRVDRIRFAEHRQEKGFFFLTPRPQKQYQWGIK